MTSPVCPDRSAPNLVAGTQLLLKLHMLLHGLLDNFIVFQTASFDPQHDFMQQQRHDSGTTAARQRHDFMQLQATTHGLAEQLKVFLDSGAASAERGGHGSDTSVAARICSRLVRKWTRKVEITREGKLEPMYFVLPSGCVRWWDSKSVRAARDDLLFSVDRSRDDESRADFMHETGPPHTHYVRTAAPHKPHGQEERRATVWRSVRVTDSASLA